MPNRALQLVSRTSTSITVKAVGLPEEASGVNWYIGTSTGSMPFVTSWDGVYAGETAAYTFSGLQPNTLYHIKFLPYDTYQVRLDPACTDSFYTLPVSGSRPANWAWESNIAAGVTVNVTAAEWNRYIDRLYAFAAYKNVSLPGSASDYYAVKGEMILAAEVNAVRSLLANLLPPTSPPAAVTKGQTITAAWFNGLKNSLNSIT